MLAVFLIILVICGERTEELAAVDKRVYCSRQLFCSIFRYQIGVVVFSSIIHICPLSAALLEYAYRYDFQCFLHIFFIWVCVQKQHLKKILCLYKGLKKGAEIC